ncbi:hypothetical protein CEXT_419401 [Caerostris extrusa]|uniref:Uncharacterized protein n=1 Tax=Caerostris extrusa TaxID=172846 RepID=A0AAV4MQF5_CAEEX|nr:hypothetical protein CEXT_419401 [Caerostris extrusa]
MPLIDNSDWKLVEMRFLDNSVCHFAGLIECNCCLIGNGTPFDLIAYYFVSEDIEQEQKLVNVDIAGSDKAVVNGLVPSGKYQFKFQIDPPWRIRRDAKSFQHHIVASCSRCHLQKRGDVWQQNRDCVINIKIPIACTGSRFTIAGLSTGFYYEIRVRAHTKTGYEIPIETKLG